VRLTLFQDLNEQIAFRFCESEFHKGLRSKDVKNGTMPHPPS